MRAGLGVPVPKRGSYSTLALTVPHRPAQARSTIGFPRGGRQLSARRTQSVRLAEHQHFKLLFSPASFEPCHKTRDAIGCNERSVIWANGTGSGPVL